MLVINIYAPLEHPLLFLRHSYLSIHLYIYLFIHALIFIH